MDFVVIGDAGENVTYGSMNTAFRDLWRESISSRWKKTGTGWKPRDCPSRQDLLLQPSRYATGETATVVGKPSGEFFRLALDDMGLRPEEAAMIGDDIDSDIAGAQAIGVRGILVRTGKFRKDILEKTRVRPDYSVDSIDNLRHPENGPIIRRSPAGKR